MQGRRRRAAACAVLAFALVAAGTASVGLDDEPGTDVSPPAEADGAQQVSRDRARGAHATDELHAEADGAQQVSRDREPVQRPQDDADSGQHAEAAGPAGAGVEPRAEAVVDLSGLSAPVPSGVVGDSTLDGHSTAQAHPVAQQVLAARQNDPWPQPCPDEDDGRADDGAGEGANAETDGGDGRTPPAEDPDRCQPETDGPVAYSAMLVTLDDGASSDGASAAAANYPGTLINETGLVRLYSTADQWEVWICDVPNRNVSYTLDEALDYLNGPVRDYLAWLSDDQYDVSFVPGGILRSAHNWDASDAYTFQHSDCGGDTTGCTNNRPCKHYADRSGIPEITGWDDVTSNGIYVGFNRSQFTSPVSGIAGLFTYVRCRSVASCPTDFPANQRQVYGDGAVFSPDTLFNRALLKTSAHELGHAIEWPHSYWRTGFGEYHNRSDFMSGGPWRVATPVINRLAAGWVDDDDIVTHLSTTGAANYTLSSPGADGLQAVTLPGSNATEYYIFGARSLQTNDWLYVRNGTSIWSPTVLAEGVEGYHIDQTCAAKDTTTGVCRSRAAASYGLYRRTEPVYPTGGNAYTGHMLTVGERVRANDLRVDVVDRKGLDWTIWVGSRHGPDRPLNVRVTRDSGTQLTVAWEPDTTDLARANFSFDVEYRSGTNAWASPTSGSGTCASSLLSEARSCTITGLTAGTAYDVRVRGVGGAPQYGDGSWTPVGGAVRNPEAAAGAAGLTVRWDPPADGASFSTAKHLVQIRSGANSFAAPSAGTCSGTIAASATRCTITGLTNATAYTVRIAAVDSSGSGAWSSNISATPTASLPAAPAKPTATGSATTLTVSWPATTDTSVTGHAVSYRTGTAAFATPSAGTCSGTITAATTSCTITGLANGTGYEVRRRLITSAGSGPWSPTAVGTPRGQPTAPTGVTVTVAHQALEVAWNAPSSSDAPASTSARVEYGTGNSPSTWTLGCAITDIAVRTCRVASLTNSTTYSVRVRFSNGTDSAWATATGTPAATAPLQLARPTAAVNTVDSLRVTWTAPSTAAQTGGSPVTGYRLEHRVWTASATAPWTSHTVAGAATSLVIGGLDTYQRYQVRVRAVNAVGSGPWSIPATGYIAPVTKATAPTAVAAVVRGSSLDITWTPPAADKVLHYELKLESRVNSSSTWADQAFIGECAALRADTAACSVTQYSASQGLDSTKQHRVSLRARNHRGSSAYSAAVQATTAAGGATPSFGASTVANQSWVVNSAVTTLDLPPAAGGTGALTYTLSPALPAGLSFSGAHLTVTGTPTAATTGAVKYTYTVTDSASPTANTASLTFTITVSADSAPVLAAVADLSAPTRRPIKTIQLPDVNSGTGNGTPTYSLEGTLPAGLTFDAATRSIGGTPTLASPAATLPKTFDVAWTARDADGDSYTVPFSLTVDDVPPQTVSYPSRLVDQHDRVRLYTQPHPDDTFAADTWEVWICDVPNGSMALTPAGVARLLNNHVSPYYRWLSGGEYRVTFVAGGSYTASSNWTPASASAMEHPGCGGTATPGTKFADRLGIPQLAKADDVSSNGMIVVYDREVSTFADGQLLYDRCSPRTHLNTCPTSFPANARRIHLDGGVVKTDSSGDPIARLRIAAHEIGQAIEFPHSFSASSTNQHDNLTDLLSGGAFPLGTAAANRYAAGWIAPSDAAVHQSTTGPATYVLAPLGSTGTQMLTLPGRDADEYYALGVREISAYDVLPAGKEGVEAYRVDHKASRVHSEMSCWAGAGSAKECYGHKRRHEPLAKTGSTDKSYGHLYGVGDSRTVGELRFEVADRSGGAYTVWVGDKDAPEAPTAALADRTSATQLTVSWTAPASGTTPTGYLVQYRTGTAAFAKPASGTCSGTLGSAAVSCTITGLASGTVYDVRVRASSSDGGGPWAPVGGSVRNPEAAAGAASLVVTWDPPAAGASYTTSSFAVQIRTGQAAFAAPAAGSCASTLGAAARHCTITGLTNGTAYDVRIAALDRDGNGAWSPTQSATPKATLPATPATPTLASGNTMVTVSWTALSGGQGAGTATVTGWSVQVRSGVSSFAAPTAGTCASTLGAAATSCTITGLANGTAYDVRVAAKTSTGSGPWSPSAQAPSGATPSAPGSLTVTAGHQHLSLSWAAPSSVQPPVSSAEVQVRAGQNPYAAPSAGTCAGTVAAATTACTITGLANGTAYDVRVRFSNGIESGWTTGSATPTTLAPETPGAPTVSSASRTSLSVSWAAPASNGAAITGYTVQYRRKGITAWSTHSDTAATLSRTITGLTTYAKYQVRVRATNSVGSSGWSAAAEQQPLATSVPGKPAAPTVSQTLIRRAGSPSLGSLTISWTAPVNSDVLSYTIALQSRADASAQWATQAFVGDCTSLDASDTSCTITDYSATLKLDPKNFHRATVTATNHLGGGQASDASASSTSFPAPPKPSISDIMHTLDTASFVTATVALPQGTQMTAWHVRTRRIWSNNVPDAWIAWQRLVDRGGVPYTSNPITVRIAPWDRDYRYDVEIRAVNDIGEGAARQFRLRAGWPRKPASFTATAGSRQVTLDASIGAVGSRSAITAWQYKQWTGSDESNASWTDIGTSGSATLSYVVTGLNGGQAYKFRVRAVSGAVAGVESDPMSATPTAPAGNTSPGGSSPGGSAPGGSAGGGGGGSASAAKPIRLSGSTRYQTAKAVSDQHVSLLETAGAAGTAQQVDTVIVASGAAFPDALAASALSRALRAPVLLTAPRSLDSAVAAFVNKHRISKAVIVGGPAAVSADVEAALAALPGMAEVRRLSGSDRYATAARVAAEVGQPGLLCLTATPTVIVTTGRNFPDALVAGPVAYRGRHPILLTERDRLPAPTAEYLAASGARHVMVVGGRSAVGDAVTDAIERLGLSTQRLSGSDRSDTSVQVARYLTGRAGSGSCFRKDSVGLATGWAFPDALAAAPLLGHYGAPLLLTSPRGVPQPLLDYAASGRLQPDFDLPPIVTVGGTSAVPARHPIQLLAALPRT